MNIDENYLTKDMHEFNTRASLIKFMLLDVDGVLTDGKLCYTTQGICHKEFSAYDGLGLKLLQQSGIGIGIITGCKSDIIQHRAIELGINYIAINQENKLIPYRAWQQELGLADAEFAYIGDDLPDLPVMLRVGLAITVPRAPNILKKHAAYITQTSGGYGAVREVCELLMLAQGTYTQLIQPYLL